MSFDSFFTLGTARAVTKATRQAFFALFEWKEIAQLSLDGLDEVGGLMLRTYIHLIMNSQTA